ncbi:MAG: MCP four helix bundle domain-containing protein [Betaproteobacteria bacterium]|nr:MCP four helix bundle domain-containing protein [Betaproteobacteria bacterium]
MDRTYQSDVLGVSHLGRAESAFLRIGRHVRQALLTADPTARKEVLSQITQSEAETFQMIESFKTKTFRESTRASLARVEAQLQIYLRHVSAVAELLAKNTEQADQEAQARLKSPSFVESANQVERALARPCWPRRMAPENPLRK